MLTINLNENSNLHYSMINNNQGDMIKLSNEHNEKYIRNTNIQPLYNGRRLVFVKTSNLKDYYFMLIKLK